MSYEGGKEALNATEFYSGYGACPEFGLEFGIRANAPEMLFGSGEGSKVVGGRHAVGLGGEGGSANSLGVLSSTGSGAVVY